VEVKFAVFATYSRQDKFTKIDSSFPCEKKQDERRVVTKKKRRCGPALPLCSAGVLEPERPFIGTAVHHNRRV
jgi:hypothetical protein